MILPRLKGALVEEKTMPRFALLTRISIVAGCAGLAACAGLEAQQGSTPWAQLSEPIQECMRYASESYCRDEIYGHNG